MSDIQSLLWVFCLLHACDFVFPCRSSFRFFLYCLDTQRKFQLRRFRMKPSGDRWHSAATTDCTVDGSAFLHGGLMSFSQSENPSADVVSCPAAQPSRGFLPSDARTRKLIVLCDLWRLSPVSDAWERLDVLKSEEKNCGQGARSDHSLPTPLRKAGLLRIPSDAKAVGRSGKGGLCRLARYGHTLTYLADGRLVLVGGVGKNADSAVDFGVEGSPSCFNLQGGTCVWVADTTLRPVLFVEQRIRTSITAQGCAGEGSLASALLLPPSVFRRKGHSAASLHNGRLIMIVGGEGDSGDAKTDCIILSTLSCPKTEGIHCWNVIYYNPSLLRMPSSLSSLTPMLSTDGGFSCWEALEDPSSSSPCLPPASSFLPFWNAWRSAPHHHHHRAAPQTMAMTEEATAAVYCLTGNPPTFSPIERSSSSPSRSTTGGRRERKEKKHENDTTSPPHIVPTTALELHAALMKESGVTSSLSPSCQKWEKNDDVDDNEETVFAEPFMHMSLLSVFIRLRSGGAEGGKGGEGEDEQWSVCVTSSHVPSSSCRTRASSTSRATHIASVSGPCRRNAHGAVALDSFDTLWRSMMTAVASGEVEEEEEEEGEGSFHNRDEDSDSEAEEERGGSADDSAVSDDLSEDMRSSVNGRRMVRKGRRRRRGRSTEEETIRRQTMMEARRRIQALWHFWRLAMTTTTPSLSGEQKKQKDEECRTGKENKGQGAAVRARNADCSSYGGVVVGVVDLSPSDRRDDIERTRRRLVVTAGVETLVADSRIRLLINGGRRSRVISSSSSPLSSSPSSVSQRQKDQQQQQQALSLRFLPAALSDWWAFDFRSRRWGLVSRAVHALGVYKKKEKAEGEGGGGGAGWGREDASKLGGKEEEGNPTESLQISSSSSPSFPYQYAYWGLSLLDETPASVRRCGHVTVPVVLPHKPFAEMCAAMARRKRIEKEKMRVAMLVKRKKDTRGGREKGADQHPRLSSSLLRRRGSGGSFSSATTSSSDVVRRASNAEEEEDEDGSDEGEGAHVDHGVDDDDVDDAVGTTTCIDDVLKALDERDGAVLSEAFYPSCGRLLLLGGVDAAITGQEGLSTAASSSLSFARQQQHASSSLRPSPSYSDFTCAFLDAEGILMSPNMGGGALTMARWRRDHSRRMQTSSPLEEEEDLLKKKEGGGEDSSTSRHTDLVGADSNNSNNNTNNKGDNNKNLLTEGRGDRTHSNDKAAPCHMRPPRGCGGGGAFQSHHFDLVVERGFRSGHHHHHHHHHHHQNNSIGQEEEDEENQQEDNATLSIASPPPPGRNSSVVKTLRQSVCSATSSSSSAADAVAATPIAAPPPLAVCPTTIATVVPPLSPPLPPQDADVDATAAAAHSTVEENTCTVVNAAAAAAAVAAAAVGTLSSNQPLTCLPPLSPTPITATRTLRPTTSPPSSPSLPPSIIASASTFLTPNRTLLRDPAGDDDDGGGARRRPPTTTALERFVSYAFGGDYGSGGGAVGPNGSKGVSHNDTTFRSVTSSSLSSPSHFPTLSPQQQHHATSSSFSLRVKVKRPVIGLNNTNTHNTSQRMKNM